MTLGPDPAPDRCDRRERLQRRWDELCAAYLPLIDGDSIWRYSRTRETGDLAQGWKLHVSATILNATQILERIAPVLSECGVQFKAARSLEDVRSLNSGLLDAYSQVGKIITVYPRHHDEALQLAERLHQLTYRFRTPLVPFDLRFRHRSNVYYRYGAFQHTELDHEDGRTSAVISASGELVPDVRRNPKPDWVSDPFTAPRPAGKLLKQKAVPTGLFRVVRALVQRGKGGVYQAIDAQSNPPRLCLLKEGRRHGELSWDGRDGAWRVRNEERVLLRLTREGLNVPQVYARFKVEGNVYLALAFIDGESLHDLLLRQQRRLPIKCVLSFGIEIASFLAQMHRAGWAWRDCKPNNLILKRDGRIVPIDFEGAEQISRPDSRLWGTRGFLPRVGRGQGSHHGLADDLYALGSIMFLLITGQMFDEAKRIPIARLRRNVPSDLRLLVESLLAIEPQERPGAENVQAQLTAIFRTHWPEVRPLLPGVKAA